MKYNYPIKYAVIPMIEQIDYCAEGERKYSTVAYIATKCHLISKEEEYNIYGSKKIQYQVVFPYKSINDTFTEFERVKPYYSYDRCANSIIVDSIFDTFGEAVLEADSRNNKLLFNTSSCKEIIDYYKILETMIEKKTEDLVVGETPKEQTVIVMSKGGISLEKSLYYLLNSPLYHTFCAYNVSQEEYDRIKNQIGIDTINDISKQNCLIQKKQDIIQIHNYKDSKEKGCFYLNNNILCYDENMLPFTNDDEFTNKCISLYTLETYDDVIRSLAEFSKEDEIRINGKIFAKKIKF